jgi:hypothetical protein
MRHRFYPVNATAMRDSVWISRFAKVARYGGAYLLACSIFFPIWFLFFLTPNVPPLWQQVIGGIVLPFGLLIEMPSDSFMGIAVCMALNVLVWGSLILFIRERILRKTL